MSNLNKIKKILSRKEPIIFISLGVHRGFACLYKKVIDHGIVYLLDSKERMSRYCLEKINSIANQSDILHFLNFLADNGYVKEVCSLECVSQGDSWLCSGVILTAHNQKQRVVFTDVGSGVTFTPI